jgi:GNAT superfamily N-acetyltransferase
MRAYEFLFEYKKYPTQDYEGIKISMVEKDGRLFVRAIDDWGVNELGSVEFVIGDGKELDPQDLRVDDRYQGQGIARTMYDYVKSRGYKIVRSWDQTEAGAGFWNKHRGEDVRVWEQGVAEGKVINTYLWHGSRQKIPMLEPRQSVDTGGAAGSNQNAIYATSDPKVAIAMGLTTAGSDTGMFPNDPQMVLFSGKIRKGEYVYLHKLPFNGPDGKPQFVQGGNSREFHSIPGVEGIKPIEIKEIPVNKYLNLIRKATPADLKLRKKYMKKQGVAEGSEQINEFSRTDDEGREFMGWREFLAIVTPAMRAWGFRPEYKNPEIMYSRPGRSQDEFYVIILQPQNDMVQYSFMTVDHDQPDMHETNFVGMSRLGAQSLLDKIDDDYSLSDLKQDMAEASDNMLSEEQPEVRPHRVTDKELVQLLGKGKTNAMLRHPWFQRYSSYEKAYRYARDRWGFVTVDMFPYMTSVNKTADGSIRPTIYVSFIFSYTGPKVVQAHQFRRDQEPDEFEKRNPVTGGWKHGSTWKVDKTDEMTEGVPQPGESSGAPKQFGPDAKIETRQMTVKQIISSIPGVPYYNNVVDDWDAKDYSWNVTKKTIEYATYLKDHPESLSQLPPILVLNDKFEDGAHRVSAIWLLQQRMDPKNPLWANTKLKVEFVKQGVTEDDDQPTQIKINSNARALAWIEKVYAAYPQTWQNNHVMPLGGSGDDQQFAMFELVPSMSQRGAVEIKWFQAYPLRQGVGTRAMQELQRLAQEDGIALTLFPWDKGQVSQIKLMKFYKSAGFKPTVKGSKSLAWSPESVTENFADGKGPGRPGDSQRHGIPKNATMAELEKASHAKGRKGQLARWQINMRNGQKK